MPETFGESRRIPPAAIIFVVFVHFTFVLVGIATTLLGVILPALASRFTLNDAVSGNLFTAHFTGSLVGTFLAERLWKRWGFSVTIIFGLVIMSAGVFGIGSADFKTVVICIFLNGVGIGLAIPATNLLVSALNPGKNAAALNILNFAWSGGAMLCPAFVGFLTDNFDVWLPLVTLAVLLLLSAGLLAIVSSGQNLVVTDSGKQVSASSPNIWQTPFPFIIVAMFFLTVGAENSLSGWLTAFSLRLQTHSNSLWTASATVFWLTFLLGRLFAPFFLQRIAQNKFILISLLIGAVGAVLLLIPSENFLIQNFLIFIGIALAGFGLAPIFPTLFAQFTNRFGEIGATKWLFVSGALGGSFFTSLVGYLSTVNESLRSGLSATFFCFFIMILLQRFLAAQSKD